MIVRAAIAILALPAVARAEPAVEPSRAGVAAGAVLPVGDWRDQTGPAGAALAWLEVPLSPRLAITARTGAIVHAEATVTAGARLRLVEVPVLGGARLAFPAAGRRVHAVIGGDVGLVVTHERVTLAGVADSDTGLRFGADLAVGLAIDRVTVEVGPWLADLTDVESAAGVELTLSARLRSW